ncbi:MAG: hypothetical protein J0H66_12985 [Solirubrobacterales bacterium]|nr:hypothetical protein [Solirubrobacterales bacterium]
MEKGLGGKLARMAGVGTMVLAASILFGAPAQAGDYVVVQCAPGLNASTEARFSSTSKHFRGKQDCGRKSPGVQLRHYLDPGETGTVARRYGAWVWAAPLGTAISGGSARSRLENADGVSGYLVVSPAVGDGVVTENQNDGKQHLSAIPAGSWRYFSARLQCTAPNQGNRCVGRAGAAHTFLKQVRLRLTDLATPKLAVGGSILDGKVQRGQQSLGIIAVDEGSGIRSTSVTVNGTRIAGDDLVASCHLLPTGQTTRMAPCPKTVGKSYSINTAVPPFKNGTNKIAVCVSDHAQTGVANTACQSEDVVVDSLCPASVVGGGTKLHARFVRSGKRIARLKFGGRTVIRGWLGDARGNAVPGATVCVQSHSDLPHKKFRLLRTITTNASGGFSYKIRRGASRRLRIAYRDGAAQISKGLRVKVRAKSTLRVSRRRTRPFKPVKFSGRIPDPHSGGRVVVIYGTVPGAKKRFLVRKARTNAVGKWRASYTFTPVPTTTRFVFWAVVPHQNGYPYSQGHSAARYIRVRP